MSDALRNTAPARRRALRAGLRASLRAALGGLALCAHLAGQSLAVEASSGLGEIRLTGVESGQPEPILAEAFLSLGETTGQATGDAAEVIAGQGCFRTPMSLALLTETFRLYPQAAPAGAPGWFGCFDAAQLGADLQTGAAVAFLSEHNLHPGVDRVVAIYPDGRAYVWQQPNDDAEK